MDNLSRRLKRSPRGFTMMELIVVMVIIAVMAAFALPRFINLQGEASQSAVDSVASSLNTATAMNFAKRKANSGNTSTVKYDNCTDSSTLLPSGSLPTGYSITSTAVAEDAEVVCTLSETESGVTATFVGLGVS